MARYLSFTDALVRSVPCPKLSSRRNSRTKPSTVCSGVAMGVVVSVTLVTLAALREQFTGPRQFVTNEQVTGHAPSHSLSRSQSLGWDDEAAPPASPLTRRPDRP